MIPGMEIASHFKCVIQQEWGWAWREQSYWAWLPTEFCCPPLQLKRHRKKWDLRFKTQNKMETVVIIGLRMKVPSRIQFRLG